MPTQQQANTEIFLHHFKTYRLGFQNGPFRVLKRTVLQCEMVCIINLKINDIQRRDDT